MNKQTTTYKPNVKKPPIYISLLVVLFFSLLSTGAFAQDPGLPGGTNDPDGNGNVPIDGGVSLLVVAGIGYGAKKIREKQKGDGKEITGK